MAGNQLENGGPSTVVRYSPTGAVLNIWTIKGNVDGLNIDPTSGLVWALQNKVTNATTPYTYGNTYTNVANRGFDDLVFSHGNVFISETNPVSGFQNNGKPLQCQLISVSGLTMTKASFQLHRRDQRMREKRAESFNRLGWTCLSS